MTDDPLDAMKARWSYIQGFLFPWMREDNDPITEALGRLVTQGRSVLRSVTGDLGFPRAEMSESIRDNPNRRLSHAGVAIGDFALDP